jgi:hypothetical protein
MDAKEIKIPLALIVIAVVLYGVHGAAMEEGGGVGYALQVLLVTAVIGVPLGIIACLIVAKVLSVGFGDARTAALKLAAIFLFPGAVALFLPAGLDWLIATALYLLLLLWLLELEGGVELALLVLVIALVRWVAMFAAAGFLSATVPV